MPGFTIDSLDIPVEVIQRRKRFTVRYGKDIRADLTYEAACTALGAALMHSARCAGKINSEA